MDKNLINEQRDNIYTIALAYLDKKNVVLAEDEDVILRFVIVSNFFWATTNSSTDVGGLFYEVAYKMPEAEKGVFKPITFPVWRFDSLSASLHYEDLEVGA